MSSIANNAGRTASVQALSSYFRDLDSIQEELEEALGGWETPVVLVFGAESAGKSTILERVAMLPLFPKGDGICTRLPILVQLRQSKDDMPPRLTVVEDEKVVDYEDMDSEEEIRKIMLDTVKRENDDVVGISKRSYLKLVVTGPDFPNLDLLDLPGLVVNPGANEPETMEEDTHELLHTWIERTKGRAIYLAIREAAGRARTSQVHRVLAKHPSMLENTLGVLTKCDEVRNRKIRQALEDDTDPINTSKHKYVVTSNEPGASLEAQAAAERQFFIDEGMSDLVDAGQATCDALVQKISSVYNEYLLETWVPTTFGLLVSKKQELKESIRDLGVALQGKALKDAVVEAATGLAKEVVDRQLDMVVDQVLEPFEQSATETILKHVEVTDLQTMQRTMNANYEGLLHDDVVRAAQGAVDSMAGLLVQGLQEALRKDVAGNAGTPARVGRFDAFVEAVVARASETIAGKIDSLKRDVEDCVKSTLRKVARPSYNLKARQGCIEMDPKALVDAVSHVILGVALAPLVDESVIENAAKACATWEESCAETRSSFEKELKSVEKVMEIEIFKMLLKKKAAKLVENYQNEFSKGTPLVCACEKGRLEDVRVLVEGHDVEKTRMSVDEMVSKEGEDSDGLSRTPLQSAAKYEQLEIVQYLVKSCPTVDLIGQTKSYDQNSLHYAAWGSEKNVQTLQWLIDNYNGDIKDIINQKHNDGGTPLDIAYVNDSSIRNDIVSLLRKYGGKANWYDKNGKKVGKGKGDLND